MRIRFNEVVRCARIVYSESTSSVKDIGSTPLKEKPIVFKPRDQILPKGRSSVFDIEKQTSPRTVSKLPYNEGSQSIATNPIDNKSVKQRTYVSRYRALPEPTVVHDWVLDIHMRIYYIDAKKSLVRTSSIDAIDGTIITTKSGSVYQLGKMDILVQKKMDGLDIDPNDPLHYENIPILVNASYDLYKDILE